MADNNSELLPLGNPLFAPPSPFLSVELIDKCIGNKIWILLKDHREITGTMLGFDDYVNVVLDDVQEFNRQHELVAEMKQVLLNGNTICMVHSLPPSSHSSMISSYPVNDNKNPLNVILIMKRHLSAMYYFFIRTELWW